MNLWQFNVLTGARVHICEVLKMIIVPDDGFYRVTDSHQYLPFLSVPSSLHAQPTHTFVSPVWTRSPWL